MYQKRIHDLDLAQICASGQTFRWQKLSEGCYAVPAFGRILVMEQTAEEGATGQLFRFSCTKEEYESVWRDYLDEEQDYGAVKQLADPQDSYLAEAIAFGGGIRILRQDLWEVMVSFVISQNNNIPRIRRSIEALCDRFGTKHGRKDAAKEGEPEEMYFAEFPPPKVLASASLTDYADLGLGYRDQYILRLAKNVASGSLPLEALKEMDYEAAHAKLMEQFGIGKKVADCICLFGLHHIDAFPIDTHIRKILNNHYPNGFPLERFRGYNGIIQQYLFYYDVNGK